MAKTFSEWIATLSAVTGLGAGDKMPVVEGGVTKYVEGDDLGGGITALTGDVTASGTGSVATTIATGAVTNAKVATGIDAAKIADGTVSNAEFQYLGGVTSDIQTQLNAKQASDADLTTISGLTPTNDDVMQYKAGAWANRTIAQLKTDLSLSGSNTGDQDLSGLQPIDADLTTIAGLTPSNDDFLQRKAGAWANRTVAQVKTDLGVPTYARYVALLTQTGTDAPVATVLENTLGGTVVWTYNDMGDYTGTLTGVFTENKTFLFVSWGGGPGARIAGFSWSDSDSVNLVTTDADGSLANNAFLNVEIRVYP